MNKMENTHFDQLVQQVQAVKAPVVVIDGMCGGGKTTLANALSRITRAPVIHMDDFFLPFSMRSRERLAEPGGNVHYERFETEVMPFVGKEEAFLYNRFDCSNGTMMPMQCPAGPMRIVEGSYSLHPRFLPVWQAMGAVTVFVSVTADEQMRRIRIRNPQLAERFRQEWIPMENKYFSAFDVEENAMIKWTGLMEINQK